MGVVRRPDPALATMPFDKLRPSQVQDWRGLRHAQAPQHRGVIGHGWGGEEWQCHVAACGPVRSCLGLVHAATGQVEHHLGACRLHGDSGTTQAHKQQFRRIGCGGVVHPAAGVQGQRLRPPSVQLVQCPGLVHFKHQRGFSGGHWQHFERYVGQQTQCPEGTSYPATFFMTWPPKVRCSARPLTSCTPST